MSERKINPELESIEAALSSLTPTSSSLQRDRLMFLAGQASVQKASPRRNARRIGVWLWPCATCASLVTAMAFGTLWAHGEGPQVIERVVYVSNNSATSSQDSLERTMVLPTLSPLRFPSSPLENRRLCQSILEHGADAIPKMELMSGQAEPKSPRWSGNRDLFELLIHDPSI
jgi:hypothetical protein